MTADPRPRPAIVAGVTTALLLAALPGLAYPRPGKVHRFSVGLGGEPPDGHSSNPSITPDGRYVAFASEAANLVPHDSNGATDVFVFDRAAGTTERMSVSSQGIPGNSHSQTGGISPDGRYVAFTSQASNLLPPGESDTNQTSDTFLHDRVTGTTERISIADDGSQSNQTSSAPSVGAGGRYVAFHSYASNIVPGDTNGTWDVFLRDREAGTTTRLSVSEAGVGANGEAAFPVITPDGRYVAFASTATNLVPGDTNNRRDVFVRDLQTGKVERVSVTSGGAEGNGDSYRTSITPDGRFVAFASESSNLVPNDANGVPGDFDVGRDVFVRDRLAGTTERVSVSSVAIEANGDSDFPRLSADGRYVAFDSLARNLVPDDTNARFATPVPSVVGGYDVFVHDRFTHETERVSVSDAGAQGDLDSFLPAVSGDGSLVAFATTSTNLLPDDGNSVTDIVGRDRGPAVGIGGLTATPIPGRLAVAGWAPFAGAAVAAATDPATDGRTGANDLGGELTGAGVVYRPERADMLVRLSVAAMPGVRPSNSGINPTVGRNLNLVPSVSGAPGVMYTLGFMHQGTRYEVRVIRLNVEENPPTDPLMSIWKCAPSCQEISHLEGGYGTTGEEIVVEVPMKVQSPAGTFSAKEGQALTAIRASTSIGDPLIGYVQTLDDVSLGDGAVPVRSVALGIAPAGTPADQVTFTVAAVLAGGSFSGSVPTTGLSEGTYDVWARACLGTVCGAASTAVAL